MSELSEAAQKMGKVKTEKKRQAALENLQKANERKANPEIAEEIRRKQSEYAKARWQRYREEKKKEAGEA